MKSIKQKFGMTTDKGTDLVAVVLAAMAAGEAFPPETKRWYFPLCLGCLCVLFWLTRGVAADTEKAQDLDDGRDIEEVLEEGRRP